VKGNNHEYASIGGLPSLQKAAIELALGPDSKVIKEKRVSSNRCDQSLR
jgi:aspartate/tyrosine/aromatic aminotransferase